MVSVNDGLNLLKKADWIGAENDFGDICPEFIKAFSVEKDVKAARLCVTAIGVYEAEINGERAGDFVFAPGWTAYEKRLQYQCYDITEMIKSGLNSLNITVGTGWFRGRISIGNKAVNTMPCAVIAAIEIVYADGEEKIILSSSDWCVRRSRILFSDIYDGEIFDAAKEEEECENVKVIEEISKDILIPTEGEKICEQEKLFPKKMIQAPNGDIILDFGQNFAGYVECSVMAKKGDIIDLSFAEVLDSDGNFYNENFRTAKCSYRYICHDGKNVYKPHFAYYGFRYIRVNSFPSEAKMSCFAGIAIYSDIKQTGFIESQNEKINGLFHNVLWSQKSNFIDVPTDCPQRDERQGWTGDAQIFAKTACLNYNLNTFFKKWLNDMCAEQFDDGMIPEKVPDTVKVKRSSTAWGDAVTIIPWEVYMSYGDKSVLSDCFEAMKKWVDFICGDTLDKYLWTCPDEEKVLWGKHYGDWLALDAPEGSYRGSSNDDFIASAFFANSVDILVKTGKEIGRDMSAYEELYKNSVTAFRERFGSCTTQTECVLALYFNLSENKEKIAKQLADNIIRNGKSIKTGFVGTPYILHALSQNGYAELAYDLLLREEYPSWLYEVNKGATTIWEHLDGIKNDGSMWSKNMNSFNHYAFGSVVDWIYSAAGGIIPLEPGYKKVKIAPVPDKRMGGLDVRLNTKYGEIESAWKYKGNDIYYEISTPTDAQIHIDGKVYEVKKGKYIF